MRLVTYQSEGGPRLGVLREENVVDLVKPMLLVILICLVYLSVW